LGLISCDPFSNYLECTLGDEGQALGGNDMLFHWQCDLAPFLSDSGASRNLITTIPSSAYVFDGSVNITLQAAAQHICNSLANGKISIPSTDLGTDISIYFLCLGGGDTMKTIPNLASITLHGFPPWPIARHAR